MKIVILDGQALNPGDLSWDSIASLADATLYDVTTTLAETIARIGDDQRSTSFVLNDKGMADFPIGFLNFTEIVYTLFANHYGFLCKCCRREQTKSQRYQK